MNKPSHQEMKNQSYRLDEIIDLFRAHWAKWEKNKNEPKPKMEFFLREENAAVQSRLIPVLIEIEVSFLSKSCENPPRSEYLSRFPAFKTEIDNMPIFEEARSTGREFAAENTPVSGPQSSDVSGEQYPDISGYEIVGVLGQGGMGKVYRARHLQLDRDVALKVVRPDRLTTNSVRRGLEEARIVARLRDNGGYHIVQVFDCGESSGQVYFSMEIVPGNLDDLIKQGFSLPSRSAKRSHRIAQRTVIIEMIADIAEAIGHAHGLGILHRDIKPSNILLDSNNEPLVSDFGLAQQLERVPDRENKHAVEGTPGYLAPELMQGVDPSPRSDVYALGVILYQLLTGGMPSYKACESTGEKLLVLPHEKNSAVDADLNAICGKCLRQEPAQRYVTATALAHDLRRVLANEPIDRDTRTTPRWEILLKWAQREPEWAFGGLAVVAILILVGLWLLAELRSTGEIARIEAHRALEAENAAKTETELRIKEKLAREQAEKDREEARTARTGEEKERKRADSLRRDAEEQTATSLLALGALQRLKGEIPQSGVSFRGAVTALERLFGEVPDSIKYRILLAKARVNLANWTRDVAKSHREKQEMGEAARLWKEGERLYRLGIVEFEKLGDEPSQVKSLINLAILLGDADKAVALKSTVEEAVPILERLLKKNEKNLPLLVDRARAFQLLGVAYGAIGPETMAEEAFDQAEGILVDLTRKSPATVPLLAELASVYYNRAELYAKRKQDEKAEVAYRKAIDHWGGLARKYEELTWPRYYLAESYHRMGIFMNDRKKYSEATKTLEKAIPELDAVLNRDEHHVEARKLLRAVRKDLEEAKSRSAK